MNYYLTRLSGKVASVHLPGDAGQTDGPFSVPDDWGMFSTKGNKRVSELAAKFVEGLACRLTPSYAARAFFKAHAKLALTKSMAEASDTAVRDAVWGFALRFKDLFGGEELLNGLWEETW